MLDGRPVLPLALTLEWLAHGAVHENAGLTFHGCDDLRVLHGVVLDDPPPTLRVLAGKAVKKDGFYRATVELRSCAATAARRSHAQRRSRVGGGPAAGPAAAARNGAAHYAFTPEEVYRRVLFHGPDMQGVECVEACDDHGVTARLRAAPAPAEWLRRPLRQQWIADPLVLDGGFQMMILWSFARSGAAGLPCHVARYRQYRRGFPTGRRPSRPQRGQGDGPVRRRRPRFPLRRWPGDRTHGRRRMHPRPRPGAGVPAQPAGTRGERRKDRASAMSVPPRVAIVGHGGTSSPPPRPRSTCGPTCWRRRIGCADVPPGRWMLDPDEVFDPAIAAPDRVYSRRGCFLESVPAGPCRSEWRPRLCFSPHAFRWAAGVRVRRDARPGSPSRRRHPRRHRFAHRKGVRSRSRIISAEPSWKSCSVRRRLPSRSIHATVARSASRPRCWQRNSAWAVRATRWTPPALRLFMRSSWPPMSCSPAGPTPCWPAASRGPTACTRRWASPSCGRCRRAAGAARSTRGPTAWWLARGRACSC